MFKKFANTIDFPYTSPTRYLTGMTALNIPAPENTGGDWHFSGAFRSSSFPENLKLAGEGLEWNTNALFGEYGIHECSDILRSRGISIPDGVQIFSANHYRAILDMLYRSVSSGHIPQHLAIGDWLDTEEQKKEFFRLLDRFFDRFSPSQQTLVSVWIENNRDI
jgi:hypothetical protein